MLAAADYARFQEPSVAEPDLCNVTAWIDLSGRDIRDCVFLGDVRVLIRGTGYGAGYTVERIDIGCGPMWRQLDERHPFEAALAHEIEHMIADLAEAALVEAYWRG